MGKIIGLIVKSGKTTDGKKKPENKVDNGKTTDGK